MKRNECIWLCLLAATFSSGCAMRTPAATDRGVSAESPPPISWPHRWTEDLPGVVDALPREYVRESDDYLGRVVIDTGITQHGIVRVSRNPRRDWDTLTIEFLSWAEQPADEWGAEDNVRAYWRKPSSWMSLAMPPDGTIRGLIVTLGPATTDPWTLRDRLPERGWALLHMGMTKPHGRDNRPSFEFDVAAIDDAAVEIAQAIDELLAEYSYGAHAGVGYVRENVEGLADVPLAVLGLSRGAMIAPAVAARLGDEVDAVALLGGGAHLLRIAQSTAFKDHGLLTINWHDAEGSPRQLRPAEREQLNDAYLDAARLDPYHTALHLHTRPTLLVTAAFDRIVPAGTGQLLYEQLGQPERWHYPFGHIATAWMINRNPDAIIDWLDNAVE